MTLEELNAFSKTLDPSAKVLVKDTSPLMKLLNVFVGLFNKTFMTTYATTICNRIYVPQSWFDQGRDMRRLAVHEVSGHVHQCRMCGLGIHPWVGFPVYALLYGILFFPLGLAVFRYLFERGADAKAWRWSLDQGQPVEEVRARSESFAETVASWDYLKPWPHDRVVSGFKEKFEQVLRESGRA